MQRFALFSFAVCSPILPSCSIFQKPGRATSQSAARSAVKISRHRSGLCLIPGLWRAVRSAERPDTISFRNFSRQTVVQTRLQKASPGDAVMGEMKWAIAGEQAAWSQSMQDEKRMKSTLVIAASIIAAVRLACDLDISRPSRRLTAVINESVSLARMILDRVGR